MAITIKREPTYPNVTYTNLVYTVSSSINGNPQFQYVMDIQDRSYNHLVRIKQYPNPNGVAVFDPAKIFNDYIEYDTAFLTGSSPVTPDNQEKDFRVAFGEEYGTSISSSVTLYDGKGVAGSPGVSGSSVTVWPGVVERYGSSYNFNTSSYSGTNNTALTTYLGSNIDTYKRVGVTDKGFTSFFIGHLGSMPAASAILRNSAGTALQTVNFTMPATKKQFVTVPSGLGSISGFSQANIDDAAYYEIKVGTYGKVYYTIERDDCYDRTDFLFINKNGVWDFISTPYVQRINRDITREEIDRPFVDYSAADSTFDNMRRGHSVYSSTIKENVTVTTGWCNKDYADHWVDLIESPEVFTVLDGNVVPIVITNASYVMNTDRRDQKRFTYDITFKYANARRGR